MQANQDIRAAMNDNGVKFWECAELVGISAGTFSVWMRRELPAEKKAKIFNAINAIVQSRKEVRR